MSPDVSVIIPTFNRRGMVHEAIESVLAQQGANFELIVVDDGSTDGTWRYLSRLAASINSETSPLVRMRTSRIGNSGAAAARNAGAALAHASLLAFLDSDDVWAPDKLVRQVEFMSANPSCGLSQADEIWLRNGVRVNPGVRHRKRAGDIFIDSLRTCLISPSAVIMRTKLFREYCGFDEDLVAAEDYDLWLRILASHEVGFLDEPLVIRRAGHAGQLSAIVQAIDRFRIYALLKLLMREDLAPDRRIAVCEALTEKCTIYANGLVRRGRLRWARLVNEIGRRTPAWHEHRDAVLDEALCEMKVLLRQQMLRTAQTEYSRDYRYNRPEN